MALFLSSLSSSLSLQSKMDLASLITTWCFLFVVVAAAAEVALVVRSHMEVLLFLLMGLGRFNGNIPRVHRVIVLIVSARVGLYPV